MSKVLVTESYLNDIASAIRHRGGTDLSYTPSQFAGAISALPTTMPTLESISIFGNGVYTAPSDIDGYSEITVDIANSYSLADEGKVVSQGELIPQTVSMISRNGFYDTTTLSGIMANVGTVEEEGYLTGSQKYLGDMLAGTISSIVLREDQIFSVRSYACNLYPSLRTIDLPGCYDIGA